MVTEQEGRRMIIKYYQLSKGEELPDEFCAVKDVGGEPSEYTFYVPESEVAKLRKLLESTISNYVDGYMDDTNAKYPCDLCDESSKQQCDYQHDRQCPFYKQLRELGVEVDR